MSLFNRSMRKSPSVAALFVLLGCSRTDAGADEILVSAAASLTDVLKEISTGYQKKSKHTVRFNFGPSNGLARQNRRRRAGGFIFFRRFAANGQSGIYRRSTRIGDAEKPAF